MAQLVQNPGILDLENGMVFDGFYLLRQISIRTSANGSRFLDMTLADVTGEINAKMWDAPAELPEGMQAGDAVKIRAAVTLWQNQLQVKVEKIRPITAQDPVKPAELVPSAPRDAGKMWQQVVRAADSITRDGLRRMVTTLLKAEKERIFYYPAAKSGHHAVRAGLLYHTTAMLSAAEALLTVYPHLNRDLVVAGVIVHDLAKVDEMDAGKLGIVSEYTVEGTLLGHITMGVRRLHQIGEEVGADPEEMMLLEHMVLSHHNEPDYGSPVRPMFAEAELLHHLDMMDARLYEFAKAGASAPEGGFSEPVWQLERRRVYHPTFVEIVSPQNRKEED
ncbi:MAG: 3'-5' exoribonuclease YhaM family protein [Christensenellales bacterium]|jgi:3'-5' exoribonuclease